MPWIIIFSGDRGQVHGYRDQWENRHIFGYAGEGQLGNMEFVRDNLALRNHQEDGKRVFLFSYEQKGYVRFVQELILFDVDLFETHDRKGDR